MKKLLKKLLIIMLLWMATSTAWAEEKKCIPGRGDSKWTLIQENSIFHLKGSLCPEGDEWNGRLIDETLIYFSGSYILLGTYKSSNDGYFNLSDNNNSTDNKRVDW